MLSFRMFLEKAQSPDYTFDRWAKTAEKLGSDVDSLVGQAKVTDAELDKKTTKAKEEKPKPDSPDIEKEDAWKRLKQISKERMEKNKTSQEKEDPQDQSKEESFASSGK